MTFCASLYILPFYLFFPILYKHRTNRLKKKKNRSHIYAIMLQNCDLSSGKKITTEEFYASHKILT